MADTSLDEFFAKKDKSRKGKSKLKFTTTDTIAKKLEEGGKRGDPLIKKDVKDKTTLSSTNQSIGSVNAPQTSEQEDDEWKNVEDEKEIDYSGLRIQALSISEKEKEEEQLLKDQMAEQNGDSSRNADGPSGPWRKVATPIIASPQKEEEKPEEPETKEEADAKPKAYKPPALRYASSTTSSSSSSRRGLKSAPPISSEVHFPSLSLAVESSKGKYSESDRSFQSVKHGVRSKGEAQPGLQLDLENKFSALHQGD